MDTLIKSINASIKNTLHRHRGHEVSHRTSTNKLDTPSHRPAPLNEHSSTAQRTIVQAQQRSVVLVARRSLKCTYSKDDTPYSVPYNRSVTPTVRAHRRLQNASRHEAGKTNPRAKNNPKQKRGQKPHSYSSIYDSNTPKSYINTLIQ